MTTDQLQDQDLIPAIMLGAFAYCPRLCYLQIVQGEFLDSAELAEGRFLHSWVDAGQDAVPEDYVPFHARSVSLSAPPRRACAVASISWRATARA